MTSLEIQVTKLWIIQWKYTIYKKEEHKIKGLGFFMRSFCLWKYFSYESRNKTRSSGAQFVTVPVCYTSTFNITVLYWPSKLQTCWWYQLQRTFVRINLVFYANKIPFLKKVFVHTKDLYSTLSRIQIHVHTLCIFCL